MQQIYTNNKQIVMLTTMYLNSKSMLMLIKVLKQQRGGDCW